MIIKHKNNLKKEKVYLKFCLAQRKKRNQKNKKEVYLKFCLDKRKKKKQQFKKLNPFLM